MPLITITGGRTLAGTLRPAAAKNSVLPLLAATLLCGAPCRLRGVPALRDVDTSLALLAAVGAPARRSGADIVTQPVPGGALTGHIPPELAGAMRSSVFYLAPLLVRTGSVTLPVPGGCRLGPRPVDIHLAGLAAMGARVEMSDQAITVLRGGALHGADITLRLPSVGATLTLMMAACAAQGTTVLRGAACEPEITDTASFLRAAGAAIHGDGTPVIVIRGGSALKGAAHTPLPDRIAAATYAAAAASAGGRLTVESCRPEQLAPFLQLLRALGCEVEQADRRFTVTRDPARPLRGGQSLFTAAYPGFATDTAPLAAALLAQADAPGRLYDSLFENRFACAAGFAALGAPVRAAGRELWLGGLPAGSRLHGAALTAPDLRGGAALLVAALAAEGESRLLDPGYIDRGYADLPGDLAAVGAACAQVRA